MTATGLADATRSAVRVPDRFYFHMAIACAAVAFLGFAPTYWAPILEGRLQAHPIVHLHGIVFFAWTLFFIFQTWLIASGQIRRHRSVGLIGIALVTAMTIFGIMAALHLIRDAAALGLEDAGRAFAIVPLLGIVFFAVPVALAIAWARQPEWHKRLMLAATILILDAPVARWFMTFLAPPDAVGPPPVSADIMPTLVSVVLLGYAMYVDWRTLGRPHPAYVASAAGLIVMKVVQLTFSSSPLWLAFTRSLSALAS